MRSLFFLCLSGFLFLAACSNGDRSSEDSQPGASTVSDQELPEMSVYQLPGIWTNQENESFGLEALQGKVTVMVMIYTTCKAACPRLIADMRRIEEEVSSELAEKVQYVFLSIDPETDTPERMKEFAFENEMTDQRWIFLRSDEDTTREFANVLAVNYKRISPMDFSHSNIISVFDDQGVLQYQQEGLDKNPQKAIQVISDLAKAG